MPKTVILIDDDQDDPDILKETITTIDPTLLCISFIYPNEALRVITGELVMLPDIVITDINMPGMTGHQVVKELRSRPEFRHTLIVVLSTSIDKKNCEALEAMGADFCFQKPNSILEYEEILRPALMERPVSFN